MMTKQAENSASAVAMTRTMWEARLAAELRSVEERSRSLPDLEMRSGKDLRRRSKVVGGFGAQRRFWGSPQAEGSWWGGEANQFL